MSGGVDSSAAAALLKEQGYEVIGITMCLGLPDPETGKPSCCGAAGINDAKRVSDLLGIRHYVLDFSGIFKQKVVDNFFAEYRAGRTPNPCVICNEQVKFSALLTKARELGAEFMATGHYARIENGLLAKAKYLKKDQSYFLYRLRPDTLEYTRFPLGELEKPEVRQIAKERGLPVSEKPDSQEICFISEKDFKTGLAKHIKPVKGPVKDSSGRVLGEHAGVAFYTIGQRQGLGISSQAPLFVYKLDPASNTVWVGPKELAYSSRCVLKDVVLYGPAAKPQAGRQEFEVRIRYLHKEAPAEVEIAGGRAVVSFKEPQFAVTPGQSAVFYRDDKVYGGGIIEASEANND